MAREITSSFEIYWIDGTNSFTAETAKAVAIEVDDSRVAGALNGKKIVWFPKSQLKISEVDELGNRQLAIPS